MAETTRPTILGVPFDTSSLSEVVDRVDRAIATRTFMHIVTPGPEFVMRARNDRRYADVLAHADLSLADGMGIQFAARALGIRGITRVTGNDLVLGVMERAVQKKWRIYLYGSTRHGDIEKAAAGAIRQFPGLDIVGTESGFRRGWKIPDAVMCWRIRRSKAEVLFVAFGAPEQEYWIARNRHRLGNVMVAAGIGGAAVYLAGTMPRAPKIMRSLGLEWLARLAVEPRRRWRRIVTAVIEFPFAVIVSKYRKGGTNA